MYSILYDSETGAYIGKANDVGTLPPGVSALPYESDPDMVGNVWDPTQRMLVPRTVPRIISRQTFIDRLGDDCLDAVQMASQGTTLGAAKLRNMLLRLHIVREVDLTDPRTIAGVDSLISNGLLPANKRAAVLG